MKMTAAAAIGALILAASAAPAFAGGYWDGGVARPGPAAASRPAHADPDCPCARAEDRQDYGDDRGGWRDQRDWSGSERDYGDERGWSDERDFDSGWRDDGARYDDEDDYAPADAPDDFYDAGPGYHLDEGGAGGGGFVGNGAFVGLGFDFRDRFRGRDQFRDHDHFSDHDHHAAHSHVIQQDHQTYPQHSGSWSPTQPHYAPRSHAQGYAHPAMHGGMARGGGRRR